MAKKIVLVALVGVMVLAATVPVAPREHDVPGPVSRTLYFTKYLPDGTVTTGHLELQPEERAPDACQALLEQDPAIQDYVRDNAVDLYFLLSAGSGLKFAFPPSLFGLSLLEVELSLIPNVIYCNYRGGEGETTIIPVVSGGNATSIYGDHRLLTIGFVGILGWSTVFTFSNTFLVGFTPYVWTQA
ncbi:MAG: hypothetical protein PHU95_01265 [Candidatus Thermoplasmatota archaeon]|nr:hypothetical protein [Candidatus Thermoplasmatota archaeon]MDD5778065.1 hypothetical protein [Candidatus Thermoplasmatota archaeon]